MRSLWHTVSHVRRREHQAVGETAALAPAAALLAVSAVAIVLAGFSPTGAGGQYAVIAPPWFNLGQTMQLAEVAGGEIVDVGGLANVVVVHADNPTIVSALYAAGAWLVLDPGRLRGCLGFAAPPDAPLGAS